MKKIYLYILGFLISLGLLYLFVGPIWKYSKTQARFERIETGMTDEEVFSLLGNPENIISKSDTERVFYYELNYSFPGKGTVGHVIFRNEKVDTFYAEELD